MLQLSLVKLQLILKSKNTKEGNNTTVVKEENNLLKVDSGKFMKLPLNFSDSIVQ
jgi:hypothetical protein